ncbi:hypothetical protein AB0G32_28640 [Streptomyces sp. NPDC023723]|uniref:hypothetical protein n=1 Tax=Streptomyces sp. NPDC023723 TaxID=3154323 RepID=UPI0033CEA72B
MEPHGRAAVVTGSGRGLGLAYARALAAAEVTSTVPALTPVIEEAEHTGAPLPDRLREDGNLGTVEDAAGLITFLASDRAKDSTGRADMIAERWHDRRRRRARDVRQPRPEAPEV